MKKEDIQKIIQMRIKGFTMREIQREMNVSSPGLIQYYIKRYSSKYVGNKVTEKIKNNIANFQSEIDFLNRRVKSLQEKLDDEKDNLLFYEQIKNLQNSNGKSNNRT